VGAGVADGRLPTEHNVVAENPEEAQLVHCDCLCFGVAPTRLGRRPRALPSGARSGCGEPTVCRFVGCPKAARYRKQRRGESPVADRHLAQNTNHHCGNLLRRTGIIDVLIDPSQAIGENAVLNACGTGSNLRHSGGFCRARSGQSRPSGTLPLVRHATGRKPLCHSRCRSSATCCCSGVMADATPARRPFWRCAAARVPASAITRAAAIMS
jgi:hypothetical protein